ncbi:MAG: AbrB/MazE/SpoVT family DNA-binding domain-containing protein [Chitinivibrionales bacterium]|nr:AbrB/MazE/SpoVT family DNA-binding domain-containing protein [Chitinivibrionales bacterium]
MVKKLTKHGNSLALVIEKPILDLVGAEAETPFEVTTDGQALVLTPVKDANRRAAFKGALDKVNRKYAKALKKPAE